MKVNVNNYNTCQFSKKQNKLAFKGYDARPLKVVLMTVCDDSESLSVIKHISEIGKKDGFKVYFTNQTKKFYCNLDLIKRFFESRVGAYCKWAQDSAFVTPENKVFSNDYPTDISFGKLLAKMTGSEYRNCPNFIQGGNLFFIKNGNKEELFVGADEMFSTTIDNLKKLYGVSDVHVIPQADFHLDMFIRPLNNKKILVADDKLIIKEIQKGLSNIKKYTMTQICTDKEIQELDTVKNKIEAFLKNFKTDIKNGQNPTADEISKSLQESGFEPVRVPGRFYYKIPNRKRDDFIYYLNYMNALVHEKLDGTLTYITNKSELNEKCGITEEISRKIDFDFEKIFVKSLAPLVKKEDIHFISGTNNYMAQILEQEGGGIHCLCNEIPDKIIY